jgi:hypothetical protein
MPLKFAFNKLAAKFYYGDERKRLQIDSVCRGYSKGFHWEFFKKVLREPWIRDICVLGVYYGRDIAYMATLLQDLGRRDFSIVGVDKFEDTPCNDWGEEFLNSTWQDAGFGPAPELEKAKANLKKLGLGRYVKLYRDLAQNFLRTMDRSFDLIYIDTSHDYETTMETIRLSVLRLKTNGLIGGDDFSNQKTWGVKKAVEESFVNFEVFYSWVWLARRADYDFDLVKSEPAAIIKEIS